MRIQARPGSLAHIRRFGKGDPLGGTTAKPREIAPGISAAPLEDLIYQGGKIVPQMEFQNVYLGTNSSWQESDIVSIDAAIKLAMQHRGLNNVMAQYFHNAKMTCDARASFVLGDPDPKALDEPDVQKLVTRLYDESRIAKSDLDAAIFNLILPPGAVLKMGSDTSHAGLGGYHGSLHIKRSGKTVTLYYSANVYSQKLDNGGENGVVAFDQPWKNVVATLYHELNEFRTDADVNDAIHKNDNRYIGWSSQSGSEVGDQPIAAAASLNEVFKEIAAGKSKTIPVQFLYSNAVHGAEGPIAKPHT